MLGTHYTRIKLILGLIPPILTTVYLSSYSCGVRYVKSVFLHPPIGSEIHPVQIVNIKHVQYL